MISPRASIRTAALSLATTAILCAVPGVAQAADTHAFVTQITSIPAEEGTPPATKAVIDSGKIAEVRGLAVDGAGHLFVTNRSETGGFRLDRFEASSGGFLSQLVPSEAEPAEPGLSGGFGVARESGEVYVGDREAVDVFSKTGVLLGTWTGVPGESFGRGVEGVAVDNSGEPLNDPAAGDVYVVECEVGDRVCQNGAPGVDVFRPEGAGKGTYVTRIEGPCTTPTACVPGEGFTAPEAVAVDEANGYVFVLDAKESEGRGAVVDIFKPEAMDQYKYLGQIAGTPTGPFGLLKGVAVDGGAVDGGDIYVADERSAGTQTGENVVDEFRLTGPGEESTEYVGRLTSAPTGPGGSSRPFTQPVGVAVDPASGNVFVADYNEGNGSSAVDVFGPDLAIPSVEAEAVSGEPLPPTLTVAGTVNPDGLPVTSCTFEYGTSTAYGQSVPCEHHNLAEIGSGTSPVQVHGELANLSPDTTYHFRLAATNKHGTNASADREFTTAGPGFVETSVTEVTSTAATLQASIDPHAQATTYHFEYDTRPYEQGEGPHGTSVPVPDVAIGSGATPVQVAPEPIQGLAPGTVYHYRAVASDADGTFAGPEQTFTTGTAGLFSLIDNRQWEQVSPPNKYGALIEPIGQEGLIQAAASGDAISYHANETIEPAPPGILNQVQALSTRTSGGWSSHDLEIPHGSVTDKPEGEGEEYRFFDEDLSTAVVQPAGAFLACTSATGTSQPCLSPAASEQTAFSRDIETGAFTPLVTGCPAQGTPCAPEVEAHANVPAGTTFGRGEAAGKAGPCPFSEAFCGPKFAGASPDAEHVVLESYAQLTNTKTPAEQHELYEWTAGKLALVSVLPGSAGPATSTVQLGFEGSNVRHAVSDDGMRVFWSIEGGHLYMRDLTHGQTVLGGETIPGETLQLDVPESGAEGGRSEPVFQFASPDGSRVFFTDAARLATNSGVQPLQYGNSSPDLYECEIVAGVGGKDECRLTDLTPETESGESADVQGAIVGASENGCDAGSTEGCYVYFVADSVLSGPGSGAVKGDCSQGFTPPNATCNLYVRHDGVTHFVAVLSGEDKPDWDEGSNDLAQLTARISPDGRWLSFMSDRDLTGYDPADSVSAHADEEVYLYNAETGRTSCASCDPTGARPNGEEYEPRVNGVLTGSKLVGGAYVWPGSTWLAANVPGWTPYKLATADYQSRYLSNSGRLFFNSHDALVPRDVNGQWDVYEYEPEGVPEGSEHACGPASTGGASTYEPAHTATVEGRKVEEGAGCVGLISSGASAEESAFLDASESGGDVFFLTTAKLEPQDYDNAFDIYDAHECTSESPCIAPPGQNPPPCETAESCRGAQGPQPGIFGQPPSATFNGQGNLGPVVKPAVKKTVKKPVKCRKGFVKNKKNRCVKKTKPKKRGKR